MTTNALMFLIGAGVGIVVDRFWADIVVWLDIYRQEKE